MARPDCPRCGSDLIVAVPSGAPSERILELRGGNVPVVAVAGGSAHWLCRSCGNQWDPTAHQDGWVPGPGDPSDPAGILADLEMASEPSQDVATTDQARSSPGSTLRRAREEAGTTLTHAAKGTGIWERHLHALESDRQLEEFPAPAYARLYLRGYAEFLHLDPEPLLRDFDALHPVVEEPIFEPLPDPRGRRRVLAGVLAVLSAVALTIIALHQVSSRPGAEPASPAGVAPVTVHDSGRVPLTPIAREPRGVRVVLRLSQPSWVEAVSDGEVVAAATLQPGEVVAYRAGRLLQLTLGNAGGVRLWVNGERVATGSPGEVVTLDVRLRDGTVTTARG